MAKIHSVTGQRVVPLSSGWELFSTAPNAVKAPGALSGPSVPAKVPGTVAQALRDAGRWSLENPAPLHDQDFWFRSRFEASGPQRLRFSGLATLAEIWLNGEKLLQTDNMFLAHEVEAQCAGHNELAICFRALGPALSAKKGRPRWRPRMIDPGTLRFFRTTLLGHLPGWCPPVHAIGPWRAIERVEESGPLRVKRADVRSNLEDRDGERGHDGVLALELEVTWSGASKPDAFVEVGGARGALRWIDSGTLRGDVRLENIEPWWPHTHGKPALYPARAFIGEHCIELGKIGFRTLDIEVGPEGRGFGVNVNGQPIFSRGACWSSADLVSMAPDRATYEPWLKRMREGGMNMVRLGGTMSYESDEFFALCDELGLLVWQDFMFANFDYPMDDPAFVESVTREAQQLLGRLQTSPALAVLCGGSEVEQQAAMLGLPKSTWSGRLFEELLPQQVLRLRPDVPYVPNSPSGGELPFSTDTQVTHYYGVGAYRRPLEDARRAQVRFASECLAFANVPESMTIARVLGTGESPVIAPRWKTRVPRDVGASWDFEDVRDHYLALLYGVDPAKLRGENPDRYLRMSRAATAEVMEEVFAQWRRPGSTCAGGLVWLFQDLWPGAGWGVVDSLGTPKAAWHALRRAFRPVQLTVSDEGLNGLAFQITNEGPSALRARLSFECLREGELPVVKAEKMLTLAPRAALEVPAAAMLDAFFDTTWAYRFGPAPHEVTVARLEDSSGQRLAEAFHFPQGRRAEQVELGLTARAEQAEGGWVLRLQSRRLAQSVHVDDEHFRAEDEWFHLAPRTERTVKLLPRDDSKATPDGEVHALNALGAVRYKVAVR
jgi:beta-mannosidase